MTGTPTVTYTEDDGHPFLNIEFKDSSIRFSIRGTTDADAVKFVALSLDAAAARSNVVLPAECVSLRQAFRLAGFQNVTTAPGKSRADLRADLATVVRERDTARAERDAALHDVFLLKIGRDIWKDLARGQSSKARRPRDEVRTPEEVDEALLRAATGTPPVAPWSGSLGYWLHATPTANPERSELVGEWLPSTVEGTRTSVLRVVCSCRRCTR